METHINNVTLVGILSAAPEWRTMRDGRQVMFLRLRTDDVARARRQWHKVTVFDQQAVRLFADRRVGEGATIRVEGELHYRRPRSAPTDGGAPERWTPPEAQVVVDLGIGRIEILADAPAPTAGEGGAS